MSHKNRSKFQSPVTQRMEAPRITKDKAGNSILLCPFCEPSHPLHPDSPAQCGTILELRAVQPVYRAKYDKSVICVKCKQGGGQMVRFQNAFVHTHDCSPGVVAMTAPPKYSKLAAIIYKAPQSIKEAIQKYTGLAQPVEEVTPDGEVTGNILGYFFVPRLKKEAPHGKYTPA